MPIVFVNRLNDRRLIHRSVEGSPCVEIKRVETIVRLDHKLYRLAKSYCTSQLLLAKPRAKHMLREDEQEDLAVTDTLAHSLNVNNACFMSIQL